LASGFLRNHLPYFHRVPAMYGYNVVGQKATESLSGKF